MSYKGKSSLELPELESVRRLRESVEGGPGSGPQGGRKERPYNKGAHRAQKVVNVLKGTGWRQSRASSAKKGQFVRKDPQEGAVHRISVDSRSGVWHHYNGDGAHEGSGLGPSELYDHFQKKSGRD